MIQPRQICEGVHLVGAVDWDRRLFDAFIPLPDGTSYNAYLIQGKDKTVLLDTVDPTQWDTLRSQLSGVPKLDHVIIHHMEQDHSGSLPFVLERYPTATVVTNPKCKGMLVDHLHLAEDRFITVKDGETLSLGDKTLKFIYTPWVHLPETMCSYLTEDKILFSCDFFATHLATSHQWAEEIDIGEPAKRYYAEIMAPFASFILKNLVKLKELPLEIICPSHGPLHGQPQRIMSAYERWADSPPHNLVCLAYVSMHGSTQLMVEHLIGNLVARGVAVDRFDLAGADLGKIAISLVDAATVVLGTPTVHAGPHPSVVHAAFVANALNVKARHAAIIGSYGWGGKTAEKLTSFLGGLKLELLEPVMCKGLPTQAALAALDQLAASIATKHEGLPPRRADEL